MIEQIPNITTFNTEFEPIDSPEYNAYCKEIGLAISYVGGKFIHFTHADGDVTLVHHPLFDGPLPKPYRISSEDGTYIDPRERTRIFWEEAIKEGRIKAVYLKDI